MYKITWQKGTGVFEAKGVLPVAFLKRETAENLANALNFDFTNSAFHNVRKMSEKEKKAFERVELT